ncbi:MAG TPA: zinc-ribbon domain-containing protein [Patescibacteria group bacterium]|nr:zinc-ribbon domain-containing protein [Patescibacteria group bacterium]
MTKFEDKVLTCEECGTEFVWDASEQAYFAKKGFKKVPKRCRACRAARKIEEEKEKKNEKEITCIKCGKKGVTSQELKEGEEIYCMDCYLKERENPSSNTQVKTE